MKITGLSKFFGGASLALALFASQGAGAAAVAVFDDASFVAEESDNIQAVLSTTLGHTVSTFTGTADGVFGTALSGADALVIPEQENGDLSSALSATAIAEITGFMASGGQVVVVGSYYTTGDGFGAAMVNALLGTAFGETDFSTASSSSITAAAAATPFAGGPASLPNLSGTSGLTGVAAANTVYQTGGAASVAWFSAGLTYIGWDFFDAAPLRTTDPQGWETILDIAVTPRDTQVPVPATALLLLAGIVGSRAVSRRAARR
ncbi:MAG: hypothetical protein H6953_03320 [Chromatiaceae bacterium]|nr:hypothetical protein [Chromatiaceae bacterium]MCP5314182.1 hypothetical protein [Chromatiaceae bacterium]